MTIEWNNITVEVETRWVLTQYISTDRGTQIIPGKYEITKVGWYGIDILPAILKSDEKENTDFYNDISEKVNAAKNR